LSSGADGDMATSWRGGVFCTCGLVIEVAVSAVGVSLVDRAWGPVAATKKLLLLTMPTSRRLFTLCIKLCRGMLLADAHMSHSSFLTLASTSASTRVVPQHDLGYRNSKNRSAETTTNKLVITNDSIEILPRAPPALDAHVYAPRHQLVLDPPPPTDSTQTLTTGRQAECALVAAPGENRRIPRGNYRGQSLLHR